MKAAAFGVAAPAGAFSPMLCHAVSDLRAAQERNAPVFDNVVKTAGLTLLKVPELKATAFGVAAPAGTFSPMLCHAVSDLRAAQERNAPAFDNVVNTAGLALLKVPEIEGDGLRRCRERGGFESDSFQRNRVSGE